MNRHSEAQRRTGSAILALLAWAALAGAAAAQVPVEPAEPRIELQGAGSIQTLTSGISCAGPDLVACAQTDAQRRMLLMTFFGHEFTDEEVLRLIAGLRDVNAPNESDGRTPLAAMIARGRVKAVAALLDRGADPLARNRDGGLLLNDAIDQAFGRDSAMGPEELTCLRAALQRVAEPVTLDASLAFRGDTVDLNLLGLLLDHGADPLFQGKHGRPLDRAVSRPDVTRRLVTAKVRVDAAELDARAYQAFADRKPELLDALCVGGADPVRYARANPQLLFDALRVERSIEVLEMVLESGADPNASESAQLRAPPLFQTHLDPDKMRLLLKYGADPNAKDSHGDTVLAAFLYHNRNREIAVPPLPVPGIETRRFPKLEVVRLLLDAGASLNGDHGDSGRAGLLGIVQREDPDVIALFVARGATLADAKGRGPLTIALEMDRDDLALALLRRDRKIAPEDRLALPLAARRGFGHVVAALLEAGADANVADAQGMTALAFAERRRDAAMVKGLLAAGARPVTQKARPGPGPDADFSTLAAWEIDDVVFFDPPRFSLALGRDTPFAFYGEAPNQLEQATCERSAAFEFIAHANIRGGIRVGVCASQAKRVRELAVDAARALGHLLERLSNAWPKRDPAMREKRGWTYAKNVGASGAEEHFFPVIVIGHGLVYAETLVLVPRGSRQAIVVQADIMNLCEHSGLETQTPLCSDTPQALAEIARRLEARYTDWPPQR